MAIAGDYTAIVEVAVSDAKLKQQLEKVSKQLERKPIKINVQMSKGLKEFEKHIIRATQAVEKLKTAMAQFDKNAKLTEAAANRVKVSMDKTRTSANNLDDTVKKVAKSMKSMDDASKQMKISVKAMGSAVKTTSGNIKTLSKIQNQAKESSKTLGNTFLETIKRISNFDVAYTAIRGFKKILSEAVEVVFDFDASLTEFKKVSDLSGDSLDKYTEKLGKMGEEVARTRSEMVQASTEFKKGGYSDEDSAQLARVASLYQNVADSELSAGDASAYVISQMKAFDIEAEDAMSIIDKTNEVNYLPSL